MGEITIKYDTCDGRWVIPLDCYCCLVEIRIYREGAGNVYVYTLHARDDHSGIGYWRTVSGRLRAVWMALRGRPVGGQGLDFYSRNSCEEFLLDFTSAMNRIWPEEE